MSEPTEREWLEGLRPEDRDDAPAHSPVDDALDRLARGPVDPAPFVATVRGRLDSLTAQVEQLTQERDGARDALARIQCDPDSPTNWRTADAEAENARPTEDLTEMTVERERWQERAAREREENVRLTALLETTREGLRDLIAYDDAVAEWDSIDAMGNAAAKKVASDKAHALLMRSIAAARALLAVSSRPPGDTDGANPEADYDYEVVRPVQKRGGYQPTGPRKPRAPAKPEGGQT